MTSVNAYLIFNGNCEEAFNFYKAAFGGEFPYVGRYGEMPPMDGKPTAPGDEEKIMHISLAVGNTVLMGSDNSPAYGKPMVFGDNVSLSINVDSREEADRLFGLLSAGGNGEDADGSDFLGCLFRNV